MLLNFLIEILILIFIYILKIYQRIYLCLKKYRNFMKKCFFNNFKNISINNNRESSKLVIKVLNLSINKLNISLKYNLDDLKLRNNSFCIETGAKRSVDSFFLLNRMSIKKNLNLCKLIGVKKFS